MNKPFDELNSADEQMEVSGEVEARLRAEVRTLAARRRRLSLAYIAAAAGLTIVIGSSAWFLQRMDRTSPAPMPAAETASEALTDFVPLGYNQIPAGSATHIVRLEVPRRALASFGLLPMDSTASSDTDTVLADVIIGDDGLARAVRFVRSTSH